MELVYTVTQGRRYSRRDWISHEEMPLISLSVRNALALCTTQPLHDDSSSDRSPIDTVYHVYVCDIDKPWATHHLMSVNERIVALEWHSSGLKLLVATLLGHCYVYQIKDFILNCWNDPPCSVHVNGEEIVAMSWLHPGGMKVFNADMKDSPLYTDKFVSSKFQPSLSMYGGKAVDGLIAITATGLAVVALPKVSSASSNCLEMTQQMVPLSETRRSRVCVADIAFDADGTVLVATSDGSVNSPIQCYHVELQRASRDCMSCHVNTSSMASFYPHCHLDSRVRESLTTRVSHVRFVRRDTSYSLIVGVGDTSGSHIELWHLTDQPFTLHRFYQPTDSTSPATVQLQRWTHQSTISHASLPTSVAVPHFPVSYTVAPPTSLQHGDTSAAPLFQYIAVAYHDGSVKLVDKRTFQPLTTTNLDTGVNDFDSVKRRKSVAYMTCMQQTFSGCVLVGIDQHSCLYVMKTMNTRDPVTHVPPVYLVDMFEYLLTAGVDSWDVLMAVKSGMLEAVQQRLMDNFNKQPREQQELYYCGLLSLRAALALCSMNGQARAADCHCQLVLYAISTHFRSVLRPKILAATEMSPAERLSTNCSRTTDADIDSVVMALSPEKKFVVDVATLQSLQPLLQWVADLAFYLVTLLPAVHHGTSFAGASLLRNQRVLATLRELLVIVRTWGLISSSCLPTFMTTVANVDVLAHLFRIVTRVWLAALEATGRDFDETLIEECCLLSSQVLSSPIDDGLFGNVEVAMTTFTPALSHPIKYTYSSPPKRSSKQPSVSLPPLFPPGVNVSTHRRDVVRQVTLGVLPPEPVRTCTRCSAMSFVSGQHQRTATKLQATRAWELRFERSCICGGQWMLDSLSSYVK